MPINELVSTISNLILILFLVGIPVYGALKGVRVYETFVDGAKQGFEIAVNIIPYLVAILVAVGMFRASGAMDIITGISLPFLLDFGITSEIIAMALTRPLSGSASLGILGEIVTSQGPDSFQARLGFGNTRKHRDDAVRGSGLFWRRIITRPRYAVHAGLVADLVGVIASIVVCRLIFG